MPHYVFRRFIGTTWAGRNSLPEFKKYQEKLKAKGIKLILHRQHIATAGMDYHDFTVKYLKQEDSKIGRAHV